MRLWVLAAFTCGICACGSRTALDPEPLESLEVNLLCPTSPQLIAVSQTRALEAQLSPQEELVEGVWSASFGAPVYLKASGSQAVSISANKPASFHMVYEGVFSDGSRHSCETAIEAVEGISARCPQSPLVALVDTPLQLVGRVFDSVAVEDAGWRQVGPSADWLTLDDTVVDGSNASTLVHASRKGMARLELFARNALGEVDTCTVDLLVPEPLGVSCAPEVRTGAGEPVELQVRLARGGPFLSHELTPASVDGEIPDASWSNLQLSDSLATVDFTPGRAGLFEVRHTLRDHYDQVATCETNVVAEPGAPTVQCPSKIETQPLTRISVVAHVSDDKGIPKLRWETVSKPPGSDAAAPFPANQDETTFRPDLAGKYTLRLTATDSGGLMGFCETEVIALATEGLRVEMFWDTDRTDMDLHLISPDANAWFTSLDCHFANCTPGLAWGEATADDDPRLDIDDTNGFGPENINIDLPEAAEYDIGVHAFQGRSLQNTAKVRVYCGGNTTEPKSTLGPVILRGAESPFRNDFWKVARVTIKSGGDCTVVPFRNENGDARVVTATAASLER